MQQNGTTFQHTYAGLLEIPLLGVHIARLCSVYFFGWRKVEVVTHVRKLAVSKERIKGSLHILISQGRL